MKRISIFDLPIKVSEAVENVYSNSDFILYEKAENEYWIANNQNSNPYHIGNENDVVEFFKEFTEEENEMEKKYKIYRQQKEIYRKEDLVQGCADEDCDPILITEFDTLEEAMEYLSQNPTEVSMTIGRLGKPIYHATEYVVWETHFDKDGYPVEMLSVETSKMDLDWLED